MKAGYHLELLILETMKLLGSTESKITKDRNSKTVPYLDIIEEILIHLQCC